MKFKIKKPFLVSLALIPIILILAPGPLEGCYSFGDLSTAGESFLLFKGGKAFWLLEYDFKNRHLWNYYKLDNHEWVIENVKSGRLTAIKPRLLYVEFIPMDNLKPVEKGRYEMRRLDFWNTLPLVEKRLPNSR
jgi:hypothetical protein